MKRHSMPEMKEGGVNVTPLIDIVMCLIIFFMLVAKIGVSRSGDPVDLPTTIMGNMIKDMSTTLTLNIRKSGNGAQVTTLIDGKDTEVKMDDLQKTLEKMQVGIKDPRVILRIDQGVVYGDLEQVLVAVAQAGISNTAYETNEPKSGQSVPAPGGNS